MSGKNLGTNKRNHQPLKGIFPFVSVGFDASSKFFKGNQMRNFVNQRDQKLVFIQTGVDGYFMFSIQSFSIITVTGHSFIDNFEMNLIDNNQLKNWFNGVFGDVFRKCFAQS